jgi:TPR repeat protein
VACETCWILEPALTDDVAEAEAWWRERNGSTRPGLGVRIDGPAARNVGTWYRDRRKPDKAVRWWTRAVALGDGDSRVELGYCYHFGIGVRRDPHRAVQFYRGALKGRAVGDHAKEEAARLLALAYRDGVGVRRSPARAIQYLQRANTDGGFREAREALDSLTRRPLAPLCCCRRGRAGQKAGNAPCAVYRAGD